MTANPWILAFHLIALFFWLGQLLVLSRLLAFHAELPETEPPRWHRRLWWAGLGDGTVVLITGLLMLHGVGYPGFDSPGAALGNYLKPKSPDGGATFWYVTFHVKLVSFALLSCAFAWLGAQVFRLARRQAPKRVWPLAVLLAFAFALPSHVLVWLSLSELGVDAARFIGYAAALIGASAGVAAGVRLGRTDSRQKFMAVHGAIAVLVIQIVILMIARPLAFAGSTLR
jgi:uncharacterized membrane protein